MAEKIIGLSIPMFFILMGLEVAVSRARKLPYYRLEDSLVDLACGVLQQMLAVLCVAFLAGAYVATYEHFRLTDALGTGPLAWVLCFVGLDFCYYWFHRASHEVALLWASHVVHHQSEDYNLAVALRQDAIQPFFSMWFYLPLALLGLPPEMFLTCQAVNLLYQFWIHTRLIKSLGPLEVVFNTPSHHRVHHGSDEKYLDKNYAGVFITWDKMFGTFLLEEEEPTYGVTVPLNSWNPLWAHLDYPRTLWLKVASMRGLANKLQALLKGPGWFPPGVSYPHPDVRSRPKYDVHMPLHLRAYVVAQFAGSLVPLVHLLFDGLKMDLLEKGVWALFITVTLGSLGGLMESKPWGKPVELARLAFMAVLPALLGMDVVVGGVMAACALVSAAWFLLAKPSPAHS